MVTGMDDSDSLAAMSPYERKRWRGLEEHWQKKAERKGLLPPKVRAAVDGAGETTQAAMRAVGRTVLELTPDAVRDVGGVAIESVLEPTIKSVVALVDLATDWVVELNDPKKVLEFHQERGRAIQSLSDLATLDLAELDEFSHRFALRWRSFGAIEGASMGALAFVPVVGIAVSVAADAMVVHLLSTGIATRSAYTYGLDAQHDEQRHHLDRMIKNSYAEQAAKAGAVLKTSRAYDAGKGRVRWSEKLREDHRVLGALERLMKAASGKDTVPVGKVVSKLPAIGVITSAGMNSHILASVAKNAKAYAQTVFLAEKYGLDLPPPLLLGHRGTDGPNTD